MQWYHAVSCDARMSAVPALMAAAYCLIAFSSSLGPQVGAVRCRVPAMHGQQLPRAAACLFASTHHAHTLVIDT